MRQRRQIDAEVPAPARQPRPSGNSVTVRDVAREAGVSVATVSRVLNRNQRVAVELRDHVLSVAQRLNYTPQAAARALATQRTQTVGAIIPTLEDPNFAVGVGALQKRLNQAGYTLLLASTNYDPHEELRQVRALTAQGIAGLLLVGSDRLPEIYNLLQTRSIPYVNTWVLDEQHPCVGFDNFAIGTMLANYLADLGHREIGVIAQHSPESDRAAKRLSGIRDALAMRGLEKPEECLIERSHKLLDGQLAMKRLLEGQRRPTAVVCGTDTLAFGAIIAARAQGLRVPEDISITGINDAEFAAHLSPPLTTVQLPVDQIGMLAAEYLLEHIDKRQPTARVSVPFNLIVRGSTGRAS